MRTFFAIVALAGCVEEKYRCENDLDCNVGADGACEIDKLCTIRSATCATGREYGPLQGAISGTCYDERRDPLNPCADGQPPARGENACTAAVCDAMPSCCRSGWSEACVKQAQIRCTTPPHEVVCDTRIAITAIRASSTEVWTATMSPGQPWTPPESHAPAASLSWFAPARGMTEPRLGVFSAGSAEPPINATLTIAGTEYTLSARSYHQAQSIDLARDAHDVLVLGSTGAGLAFLETFDLDTKERHEFPKQYTIRNVVGEVNRDMYPDIASCSNAGNYAVTLNEPPVEGTDHRQLGVSSGDTINGQETTTINQQSRAIEFADLDNNRALDMIVSGKHIRLHMPATEDEPLNASVHTINLDCIPPVAPIAMNCNGADQAAVSWVATARPGIDRTTLIAAPWGNQMNGQAERRIYELEMTRTGITSQAFVPQGPCIASCDTRWAAIATRDLDGDHVMDIIAVDENLDLYTSSSKLGGMLLPTLQIDQPSESISNVRITLTGAPYTP
jgi:hypothetical protein